MSIVEYLISKDFTIVSSPTSKWAKTEEHDSLVIDREKDVFFWNSRRIYGGPIDYLTKVKGYSDSESKRIVSNIKFFPKTGKVIDASNMSTNPVLPKLMWRNGQTEREYWYDRCLTDKTIDRWLLGYYNGWYTLPVYSKDTLLQIQLRRDKPERSMRLWYRKKPIYLVNDYLLSMYDTIFFTEGAVDSILLNQFNIPTISRLAGGKAWNDCWYKEFINTRLIYYIADNDDIGIQVGKMISQKLGEFKVKIFRFNNDRKGYDTVDYFRDGGNAKEFKELVISDSVYGFYL